MSIGFATKFHACIKHKVLTSHLFFKSTNDIGTGKHESWDCTAWCLVEVKTAYGYTRVINGKVLVGVHKTKVALLYW